MAKLVVEIGHQKEMCHNKTGLGMRNINTIVGSLISRIGRPRLSFKPRILTFTLYDYCISPLDMKLDIINLTIHIC